MSKKNASVRFLRNLEEQSSDRPETPPPLTSRKLGIKLFFADKRPIEPPTFLPVFQRWIRERSFAGERLVDVVAYEHASYGPWVMLIGASALWIVDAKHGEPGLRYSRRRTSREGFGRYALKATPRAALRATYASALTAARLLSLDTGLGFTTDAIEVEIADRVLAPNTPETFARTERDLRGFGREVFESPRLLPMGAGDPQAFFRVRIEGTRKRKLDDLIERLDRLSRSPAL